MCGNGRSIVGFGMVRYGLRIGTVPLPLLTAQPLPVRVTDDLHMAKFDSRYAVPTLLVSVFLSNVAAHLH